VRDFEVIGWIILVSVAVIGGLVKRMLEKPKGPVPQPPPGEAGGGAGDPVKDLRDFLRQLEGLAKGEDPRRTEAPPPKPAAERPAPLRRPPPAQPQRRPATAPPRVPSTASPKTAQIELPKRVPQTAHAGARLGTGVAQAVSRVTDAPLYGAAQRMPSGGRAAAARIPMRLPILPGAGEHDIGHAVIWSEILGQPRAKRPWRARMISMRSA
jgi:hypothetical protein